MAADKFEIIKQFIYIIDGVGHPVYVQIERINNSNSVHWDISHYYRPSVKPPNFLHPQLGTTPSISHAEAEIDAYIKKFTGDFIVVENPKYKSPR